MIGGIGTGFSAYMHFKLQNASLVTPIKDVREKIEDNESTSANSSNKVPIQNLDPAKLMSQSETNKNTKKI